MRMQNGEKMTPRDIHERAFEFACRIVRLHRTVSSRRSEGGAEPCGFHRESTGRAEGSARSALLAAAVRGVGDRADEARRVISAGSQRDRRDPDDNRAESRNAKASAFLILHSHSAF